MGMYYGIVAFTILAHITGLCGVGMLLHSEHSYRLLFDMTSMMWIFGFGVTAGLHRLWSHRSYKARPSFRILLWFLACGANQGSIIHWVRDHRAHHKYSDTDADPHNINRGFFFAHMGWLMQAKHPQVTAKGAGIPLDDLHRDFIVRFDKRTYPIPHLLICFLLPTAYGYYQYDSALIGLVILGVLRWLLQLHFTWCINSVAHTFGYRPYRDIRPTQNLLTSIMALGEGWHNYHHTFPYDYATSEGPFEFNPTTWLLDCAAFLGLVYDRQRANPDTVKGCKELHAQA